VKGHERHMNLRTRLRPRPLRAALFALIFAAAPWSQAAAQADPFGAWTGEIKIPGAALGVRVELRKGPDGPTGSIDIPKQNAKDLPLRDVTIEGAAVSFAIADVPGAPAFKGAISDDGATLSGTFRQSGMKFPFALARATAESKPAFDADAFAAWCEEARAAWKAPGLAVALVRKDETFFVRGFGARDVEANAPVTGETLFSIGSTTKAMTAWILATLVEEGKIRWDDRVRAHLPTFALKDPFASERVAIGDLVTHRTGLPRHDLVWYGRDATREELVAAMAHLEATADLRETWQYNNLAFVAAGLLAEKVAGATWEDLVLKRIFEPLGMTRASFSAHKAEYDPNAARPYVERDGKIERTKPRDLSAVGPAGSVVASAEDCARWIRLQLGRGTFEGRELLPASAASGLHVPRTLMEGGDSPDEATTTLGYAAGWMVLLHRGERMIEHGGGIDGFTTAFAFFPDSDFGVVALANASGSGLPNVVVRHAVDRYLKKTPRDWSAEGLAKVAAAKAAAEGATSRATKVARQDAPPSRPLAEFAGTYKNEAYGTATVVVDNGEASISIHGLKGPLVHRHFDVFRIGKDPVDPTLDGVLVQFRSDFEGEIEEFLAPLQPGAAPIVFMRALDPSAATPEVLRRYEGRYRLGASSATVALRGAFLELRIKGQPRYELVPTRERRFSLKGMEGYSIVFEVDASGRVVSLASHQPEGVFVMTREE
jgi:CubicO group peptidase (beta-lactamase class C family)